MASEARREYLYGRIMIGGSVTPDQFSEIGFRAGAREQRVENDCLLLEDPLAVWGRFDLLEPYLREEGIPYDRWSEAFQRDSAVVVKWRPGMDEPVTLRATNDLTETYLSLSQIKGDLQAWFAAEMSDNRLVEKIKTYLGALVPPLPTFRVETAAAPSDTEEADTEEEAPSVADAA